MKDQIRNAYPAPSLVEEVARAICEVEALPNWRYQNCPQRDEHLVQARAAIAVVLRRMDKREEMSRELCRLRELVGEMAGYLQEALQPGSFNERDVDSIRRLIALTRKSGGGGQGPY